MIGPATPAGHGRRIATLARGRRRPRPRPRRWRSAVALLPALSALLAGCSGASIESTTSLLNAPDLDSKRGLVSLGRVPAPIGTAATAVDAKAERAAVGLYETSADVGRVAISDLEYDHWREIETPGSRLVSGLRFDRTNPDWLWVAGSEGAVVHQVDAMRGLVMRSVPIEGSRHVQSIDQANDGTIYVGTYPDRRLLEVVWSQGGRPELAETGIDPQAASGRAYLHGIFAADDALYLHYRAPSVIVRWDRTTGAESVLASGADGSLLFRVQEETLTYGSSAASRTIDRAERVLEGGPPARRVRFRNAGDVLRIEHGPLVATVPLHPRASGMRITSLAPGPRGRVFIGTFWNRWLASVGVTEASITSHGAIPGALGEFFTAASWRGSLVIPHYRGRLFRLDPTAPITGDGTNPRLLTAVPSAHFGQDAVVLPDGALLYACEPDYGRPSTRLVRLDEWDEAPTVLDLGTEPLAVTRLAVANGWVWAGAVQRAGLGFAGQPEGSVANPMLLRLHPTTLQVQERVPLPDRDAGEIRGLVGLRDGRLLCLTARTCFLVTPGMTEPPSSSTDSATSPPPPISTSTLTSPPPEPTKTRFAPVDGHWLIRRLAGVSGRALARLPDLDPDRERLLVLMESILAEFDASTDTLRVLGRLPRDMQHLAVTPRGWIVVADAYEVFSYGTDDQQPDAMAQPISLDR